jgi:hypothetical protein
MNADGYVVAKANRTALPFVAKARDVYPDGWIVLMRFGSYLAACAARDSILRGRLLVLGS